MPHSTQLDLPFNLTKRLELRPIPGVSWDYAAGSDGHIYSRKRGEWKRLEEALRTVYPYVSLSNGKRRPKYSVHRLVCMAFHGAPRPGQEVRHLDGDSKNNLPGNLAWGTKRENASDTISHGNQICGEKCHTAKLTEMEVLFIRASKSKPSELAKTYGVDRGMIWRIQTGRSWKHLKG